MTEIISITSNGGPGHEETTDDATYVVNNGIPDPTYVVNNVELEMARRGLDIVRLVHELQYRHHVPATLSAVILANKTKRWRLSDEDVFRCCERLRKNGVFTIESPAHVD